MANKYFPIKTATACQLKWAFSRVALHYGRTASCHRVNDHPFDINTFNFHNTPEKIHQREMMLAGEWPKAGCEYCENIERTGVGQSDRQFFSDVPNLSPTELDNDPTATSVSPTILEVYLDNACNLSCIYCIPELSSRIHGEMVKFGPFKKNGLVLETNHKQIANLTEIQEKFWQWLEQNVLTLRRLQFLGGEPLYQQHLDTFLDLFDRVPCPNLEFEIVTNLMVKTSRLEYYMERIKKLISQKKLKQINVLCSIDCWGPQQEFVRYGLDLTQWEENFKYLISQKWIIVQINNTISALTIKTLPDLLVKLQGWGKHKTIEQYFSTAMYPSYMHPTIFGSEEFKEDLARILGLMETDSWQGTHAKSYMQGIVATIENSVYNKEEVLKLLTYLDELDRRRNTNWRELFPWLEKYNVV